MTDLRLALPHCEECRAVGEPSDRRHKLWCSLAFADEVIAVLPAPRCELCGVPFDPNAPEPQSCGGMPCLVPENEIIDWIVRVRSVPSVASPLGRWPAPELTSSLLVQGARLAVIAAELARDLGAQLVPQVGPYCPSYVRRVPALQLTPQELEIMQRGWHLPSSPRTVEQVEALDRVWATVAKYVLESICDRLQAEFR